MDNRLEKYIEENRVCSDLIFRNWSEFIELLFSYWRINLNPDRFSKSVGVNFIGG